MHWNTKQSKANQGKAKQTTRHIRTKQDNANTNAPKSTLGATRVPHGAVEAADVDTWHPKPSKKWNDLTKSPKTADVDLTKSLNTTGDVGWMGGTKHYKQNDVAHCSNGNPNGRVNLNSLNHLDIVSNFITIQAWEDYTNIRLLYKHQTGRHT